MDYEIVRADSALEGLIWLVIFVFWIVSQLFTQATKGKRPKQRPPRRPGRTRPPSPSRAPTTDQTIRDFLEGLEEATQQPPPTPAIKDIYEPPPLPPDPEPPPIQRVAAPPRPPPPGSAAHRETHEEFRDRGMTVLERRVKKFEDLVERVTSRTTMPYQLTDDPEELAAPTVMTMDTRSQLINLGTLSMPMMSVPLPSLSTAPPSNVKLDLHDQDDVRRAIVGRIILSPPKALAPEGFDYGSSAM